MFDIDKMVELVEEKTELGVYFAETYTFGKEEVVDLIEDEHLQAGLNHWVQGSTFTTEDEKMVHLISNLDNDTQEFQNHRFIVIQDQDTGVVEKLIAL